MIKKLIFFALVYFFATGEMYGQDYSGYEKDLEKERKEQSENYQSEEQDEESYYKAVEPKDVERDRDFFMKDHPLEEEPLK